VLPTHLRDAYGGGRCSERTLQEWMGHADFKTTLIYADYSPDERRDRDLVARAFEGPGSKLGSKLSETESNSDARNGSTMREGA
jgi:hypothetical protein